MTEEALTEEQWMKDMDDYAYRLWSTGYQQCDLTYFDGEDVITWKDVRVGKDDDKTIYHTLENDKFLFVIRGDGASGDTDDDRLVILNTSSVIHLDITDYGMSETVDDIDIVNDYKR